LHATCASADAAAQVATSTAKTPVTSVIFVFGFRGTGACGSLVFVDAADLLVCFFAFSLFFSVRSSGVFGPPSFATIKLIAFRNDRMTYSYPCPWWCPPLNLNSEEFKFDLNTKFTSSQSSATPQKNAANEPESPQLCTCVTS